MKRVTLSVPTVRLMALGLFPPRFFRNNESLEVLQAFHLGGDDLTLLVRVRRRGRGPPEGEGAAPRGAAPAREGPPRSPRRPLRRAPRTAPGPGGRKPRGPHGPPAGPDRARA